MLHSHVHAVDIVQSAVVRLTDDGEAPEALGALRRLSAGSNECVTDSTHAVGVCNGDRRGERTGLPHPLESGQLAAPVETMCSREQRSLPRYYQILPIWDVRQNNGDTCPHWSHANAKRTLAADKRGVSNSYPCDVG